MKYKILIISILGLLSFNTLFSNGSNDPDFYPSKNTFAKVYSNFHYGLSETDHSSAFEITRAYFGFKHQFDKSFSATVKLDIGSPNDESQYSLLRRYAYFKTAALHYNYNKLSINFGLVDLFQFKTQEKFWDKRYVYKSFQDEHKYGSSADIGISAAYKLNKNIKLEVAMMNGEGYKKLQSDDTYKSAFAIEINYSHLLAKFYYDYTKEETSQTTYSAFLAYKNNHFKLATEYNFKNNKNFDLHNNLQGQSFYTSYNISSSLVFFIRYDILRSNLVEDESLPWNIENDGSALISGIQYSPVNNVKLALNYQDWYPYAADEPNVSFVYFNVEFSF